MALMVLGRWTEAETVLRPIVAAESELAEARSNLSIALLCQDEDEEAGYMYRLAARRNLYDLAAIEETGGRLPLEQFFPACQELLRGQWGSKKLALQAYENSRRDHAAALYYEQTGLAANLADPLHHEAASLMAAQNAEAAYGDMMGPYGVANGARAVGVDRIVAGSGLRPFRDHDSGNCYGSGSRAGWAYIVVGGIGGYCAVCAIGNGRYPFHRQLLSGRVSCR